MENGVKPKNFKKLTYHEWFFVISFITLLLGVMCYSLYTEKSAKELVEKGILENQFTIRVEGAVEKSGLYIIEKGITFAELLDKVGIKEGADLSHLKLKNEVNTNALYIPYFPLICVEIRGEVKNPGKVLIRKRSRICDLAKIIEILPDGESAVLNKRRYLKGGEIINIPRKKSKKLSFKKISLESKSSDALCFSHEHMKYRNFSEN